MTSTSHSFTRTLIYDWNKRVKSAKPPTFLPCVLTAPVRVAHRQLELPRGWHALHRVRRARAAIEDTRSCTHAASAAVRRSRFPRLCEIVGTVSDGILDRRGAGQRRRARSRRTHHGLDDRVHGHLRAST